MSKTFLFTLSVRAVVNVFVFVFFRRPVKASLGWILKSLVRKRLLRSLPTHDAARSHTT